MAVTTSTRPSSRARARASPVARRRRGASVAARDASSSVPPPSPPPMEIAAAADASEASRTSSSSASADADARPNAETLVDAFESLPKEERVRLVERYVFGVGSEIVAPDVKMDVDVDGVAAIGRAELTEEELADLRDFGPPPKAGSGGADAFQSEDALVDKWREVFGEDPPENGGGGVEDILGPEPEGIGSIVGGVKSAVSLKLYGVERAWDKLAYRFGRVGAIVASGLASVGIAVVVNSLIPKSQGAKDDVDLINRVSSVGRKTPSKPPMRRTLSRRWRLPKPRRRRTVCSGSAKQASKSTFPIPRPRRRTVCFGPEREIRRVASLLASAWDRRHRERSTIAIAAMNRRRRCCGREKMIPSYPR